MVKAKQQHRSKFAPHETKKTLFSAVLKMLLLALVEIKEQKQNAALGDFAECSIYRIFYRFTINDQG